MPKKYLFWVGLCKTVDDFIRPVILELSFQIVKDQSIFLEINCFLSLPIVCRNFAFFIRRGWTALKRKLLYWRFTVFLSCRHMGPLKSMKYGSIIKAIQRFTTVYQKYGMWPSLSYHLFYTHAYNWYWILLFIVKEAKKLTKNIALPISFFFLPSQI